MSKRDYPEKKRKFTIRELLADESNSIQTSKRDYSEKKRKFIIRELLADDGDHSYRRLNQNIQIIKNFKAVRAKSEFLIKIRDDEEVDYEEILRNMIRKTGKETIALGNRFYVFKLFI